MYRVIKNDNIVIVFCGISITYFSKMIYNIFNKMLKD